MASTGYAGGGDAGSGREAEAHILRLLLVGSQRRFSSVSQHDFRDNEGATSMATKANKSRYRTMRSAVLSASVLSFIPLFAVMKAAAGGTASSTVVTTEPAPAQLVAAQQGTAPSGTSAIAAAATPPQTASDATSATAASTATTTKAAATPTTAATTYTRTKAS